MEKTEALAAFNALSQETRLDVVKLLVQAGPNGLPAGDIAQRLNVQHNLLSRHLSVLTVAKLTSSERQGRLIIYRARFETLRALLSFLMIDCCAGLPEILNPLPNVPSDSGVTR